MNRRRALGIFSVSVGALLLLAMGMGLGRALRGQDPSAFFVTPFLLTAGLVCLGVGFHQLWGRREPPEGPETPPPANSSDSGPASP